jgi:MarR family transcriptional regulator, organic hydroperoxide resistance regulator
MNMANANLTPTPAVRESARESIARTPAARTDRVKNYRPSMPRRQLSFERTIAGLARITEVALAEQGLTIQKYRVLSYLAWTPMFPTELADHLSVRPPVISRIVEGLIGHGYVERHRDATDRRRSILEVSKAGAAALRRANAAISADVNDLGGELTASEQRAAFRGLELWGEAMLRYMERLHDR